MEINGLKAHDLLTKEMRPQYAFRADKDFDSQRGKIKEKLFELLGLEEIAKNACDPSFCVVERKKQDGYEQIRFEIESERGAVVPCYLLVPDKAKKKYPVVITLQGHNKMGFHSSIGNALCHETLDYDTGRGMFAVQAVRRGYIALAIEQRGMGERSARNSFERRVSLNPDGNCYYEAMTAITLGRTIIGERCWDISRVIDALSNFPQCDTDRIAITGNSGGGTASYYAACCDERIKLCVPSCAFCPYPDSILKFYHCSCNYIPNAFKYFDMQDLSCLIAPRKLVIIAGKYDTAFRVEGVERGFETVKSIYEKIGSDNCRLIVTDKGHWWCEDIVWEAVAESL